MSANISVNPVINNMEILLSSFYDTLNEATSVSISIKQQCRKSTGPLWFNRGLKGLVLTIRITCVTQGIF